MCRDATDCTVDDVAAVLRRAAPFSALPRLGAARGARHARRPLPLRRVRRAAAAARLGPGHRHAHRPGRRAAAGGHQRRHHPRPRAVRRLPGRRRRARAAGGSASWTRRWSTSPGSATSSCSGSSSWRIEEITHDRVLVSPAPGLPGQDAVLARRHPGPAAGARPGAGRVPPRGRRRPPRRPAPTRARAAGLDEWARRRTCSPTSPSSRQATGHLPDDRTIAGRAVPRRARRLAAGRPLAVRRAGQRAVGAGARRPAARALRRRRRSSMHSDDGIVLRLPDTDRRGARAPTWRVLDPDDVEREVTAEVGGSALFACRFRECAARALLLPRRDPRPAHPAVAAAAARRPAARRWPASSPSSRSPSRRSGRCLQDVFDVPGLVELMRDVARPPGAGGRGETPTASPFAQSLLFGYVGAVHLRGRRAAGRAPGAGAGAGHRRCWPSCWAAPSCASCSTPTRWPRSRPSCSGCPSSGTRATSTAPATCSAASAT